MRAFIPNKIVVPSFVRTITVTGSGHSSRCYLTLPDGTTTYAAGEYEFEKGAVIKCCVKGSSSTRYGTVIVNGETVYQAQGTTLYEYEYAVTKNATIALSYSTSTGTENGSRITITEV